MKFFDDLSGEMKYLIEDDQNNSDNQNNFKTQSLKKFAQIIDDNKITLVDKMTPYVTITKIIQSVTESCKEFQFLMKPVFENMIKSYTYQGNILTSVISIMARGFFKNKGYLSLKSKKGVNFDLGNCDSCGKQFNEVSQGDITIFNCGHKYHYDCCILLKNGGVACPNCKKNEVDLFSDEKEEAVSNEKREKPRESIYVKKDSGNDYFKQFKGSVFLNRKNFDILSGLDRKFVESENMMDNSNTI